MVFEAYLQNILVLHWWFLEVFKKSGAMGGTFFHFHDAFIFFLSIRCDRTSFQCSNLIHKIRT